MISIHKDPKKNKSWDGMVQWDYSKTFKNIQKQIETHTRCKLLTLTSLRGLCLACVQSI